ncbi:LexA family protein [Rhizobium panacihumi]|uniref:LexA family protein n=1 Tax=Rhizobium panacihumi TaxID=2008450 RepID=UPI003D790616
MRMNEIERPAQSRVWRWRRAIGESDLPATTRDVLRVLSEFMDVNGASCFPTVLQIAEKMGRDRGTVSHHLNAADQAGWIEIQVGNFSGQKHRRQSYLARWPDEPREPAENVGELGEEVGGIRPHDVAAQSGQDNTSPKNSPTTSPENAHARGRPRADLQRINKQFLEWLPTWPKYAEYSDATARRNWRSLSDAERAACIRLTPFYLKQFGNKRSSPGDYLRDRAWEGLSLPEEVPEWIEAKSFSPLWMATRFSLLLQPPSGQIIITAFERGRIDAGSVTLDEVRRPKLIAGGWPAVNGMLEAMRKGRGWKCPAALADVVGDFKSVKKDSDLFAAWSRLHERRGWPFFSFAPSYVPFPAVDLGTADLDAAVDAVMTEFAALLSKV